MTPDEFNAEVKKDLRDLILVHSLKLPLAEVLEMTEEVKEAHIAELLKPTREEEARLAAERKELGLE